MADQEPTAAEPPPTEPLEAPEPPPTEPLPVAEPAPPPPPRRLVRSRRDRVLAGVCGGIAEYFGIDSVLVRIATLLLVFAGGAGLVLYVVGWIAMPEPEETMGSEGAGAEPRGPAPSPERTRSAVLLGLVFIALGVFFLVDEIWPDFLSWQYVWPVALIAIGLAVLARARR